MWFTGWEIEAVTTELGLTTMCRQGSKRGGQEAVKRVSPYHLFVDAMRPRRMFKKDEYDCIRTPYPLCLTSFHIRYTKYGFKALVVLDAQRVNVFDYKSTKAEVCLNVTKIRDNYAVLPSVK